MLSSISDILSIIGFIVTIYVACTVRRIKQSYVKQVFVETYLPKLRAAAKNIRSAIERADETQLRQELQRCKAILKHVLSYATDEAETRNAITVIDRVSAYRGSGLIGGGEDVYDVVVCEAEKLDLLRTELRWSHKNG